MAVDQIEATKILSLLVDLPPFRPGWLTNESKKNRLWTTNKENKNKMLLRRKKMHKNKQTIISYQL